MATLAEGVQQDCLTLTGLPLPLTVSLPTPWSDDELIAFSRNNRPYRIERNAEGELEIMSPVGFDGGQRELFVMRTLGNWAEQSGGICVSCDTGFTLLDRSVRSPDASWVPEERVNALTADQRSRFPPFCPDFLIEILSPSDSRKVLEAKMEMWIDNGAQLAWMIDPFAADLTVYKPGQPSRSLARPDWVEADDVVPGFRLQTARLWAK